MALVEQVVVIKLLKILAVLFALVLVILALFNAGSFVVMLPTFQKTRGASTQFERFFSEVKVNPDDTYSIQLRDVVASARAEAGAPKYFNMDLTVSTSSKQLADSVSSNPEAAVNTIRSVMGRFSFDEVKSVEGKEHLKREIKSSLSQRYGIKEIDDIYFEQFYQY
ncbi:MAG: flagellar basal body-associated FliL family protein [Deferribacteraceae bacterium]|jgi:flagellar basal body-associated protein FliL|nr:flagellar basal body-associated FliL family protein [Deferribacteraceae bacterium]